MDDKTKETQHLIQVFKPTKLELIVIPLAVFVFLMVNNGISYLKTADGTNYALATDIIETRLRGGLRIIDYIAGNTVLTMIFWMFIGLIVYTLSWFAIETYHAYHDELPATKGMVFPRGYKKSNAMHEAIARISTRTVAAVFLFIWLYVLLVNILPYASSAFFEATKKPSLTSFMSAILSVIVVSASVFLVFILCRCVVLRNRVFKG